LGIFGYSFLLNLSTFGDFYDKFVCEAF